MKKSLILLITGLCLCAAVSAMEPKIESTRAAFYVGQEIMVCGPISEVKPFSKGTYLSMGPKYPQQHLTVLVWDSNQQGFNTRFGSLDAFKGRSACVRGLLETYKNTLQIKVSNPQFLRLMK